MPNNLIYRLILGKTRDLSPSLTFNNFKKIGVVFNRFVICNFPPRRKNLRLGSQSQYRTSSPTSKVAGCPVFSVRSQHLNWIENILREKNKVLCVSDQQHWSRQRTRSNLTDKQGPEPICTDQQQTSRFTLVNANIRPILQ